MKVKVQVETLHKEKLTLNLTVTPEDTVQDLKSRVCLAEPNPFPNQVLLSNGKPLQDDACVTQCVQDGGVVDFRAYASEDGLVNQLEDLSRSKGALGVDELGLLFCLKHGVTVGQALQALGKTMTLEAFIMNFGKRFSVQDGIVKLAHEPLEKPKTTIVNEVLQKIPEDSAMQKLDLAVSVTIQLPYENRVLDELHMTANTADVVHALKDRIRAETVTPFSHCDLKLNGKVLSDDCHLSACGISDASALECLVRGCEADLAMQITKLIQAKPAASCKELDQIFNCRHGVSASAAVEMLGWGEKLQQFLSRHPAFSLTKTGIKVDGDVPNSMVDADVALNHRYIELATGLVNHERHAQLMELASSISPLVNVSRIVLGGAVAKGTSVSGRECAELVLIVPPTVIEGFEALVTSITKILSSHINELPHVSKVTASSQSVCLHTDGPLEDVFVYVLPDQGDYASTIKSFNALTPRERISGSKALTAQKVRFVQRQPAAVKATIRLMKWWRDQRQWSSEHARPSDELIELLVAHSILERTPSNLKKASEQVLSVMAKFDQLAVTWPISVRSYRVTDVDQALLQQRPLLLDPCNPLVNLADSQVFLPRELMEHARSGFF